jgi:predicted O-methyltransferase YrrM
MTGSTTADVVRTVAAEAQTRLDLWAALVDRIGAGTVAEIGVYRGVFAAHMLASCPRVNTYYMIDPWRHLDDWNKPANRDDPAFQRLFAQAMDNTRAHESRRVVLRGRTTEVIDQISDGSLDFAYIDGDHTLRGITVDLARVYPKVREGGFIGGDDFSRSIWQHGAQFEPTLVFPYAVYFAEAVGSRIYGLPHGQFLMERRAESGFEFVDLTGKRAKLDLLSQMTSRRAPQANRTLVGRALRRLRR